MKVIEINIARIAKYMRNLKQGLNKALVCTAAGNNNI